MAKGGKLENLSGQIVKGYELRERIGAGGFGAVYRANQSTVGREVAIKIILPHFTNHPDFIRRFETEAHLIARLEHLHIIPLYDYWRDPDGAYLVMRWLRGGSLRDALHQNGSYDLESAALLLDQIASALASAHRSHVIHRDLKPGNVLLDEDGNAYLADFGIAKDLGKSGITELDTIVGSPDYIAPEQARSELVTPQTDIYSLGVVLYEIIMGAHPFPNLTAVERLYKHLNDPLPIIPNVPDGVNAVIQKATAKNPAHRYADAIAMAVAFREAALPNQKSSSLVESLTPREQEILQGIIAGKSNKEIASELFVTLATVKWYIKQIYAKLHVRSRVQAIVRARELNLIVGSDAKRESTGDTISSQLIEPENPYKGLRAFQSADNRDFFGRESLVEKLVKRLGEARFLAVVGPSGSGKSSLVKAGLIPALWRGEVPGSDRWFIVETLPGSHPLDELEIALLRVAANQSGSIKEQLARDERGLLRVAQLILPDDGSELVLVIDQFEEIFTLVEDESARQHFLNIIHSAVSDPRSRVRVVITLRADFYDRPLHYPQFGELVRSRMETVLPLGANGLERAIAKPAEQQGVKFEEGLVASIISEVNYQPGALPLLQYALTELFERRQGRLLTHEAYREIGGTVGALAKRADEIFAGLEEAGKEAARQMFLRLVMLGEGVEDTRRRVARAELMAIADDEDLMDDIIDTYAEYRLLSLDNDPGTRTPTVEVAHEAILREWKKLRSWINENREEIRMQQQLAHLVEEWVNAGKDVSYLVGGLRLEQFEKWAQGSQLALTADERAYLNASIARREHENEAESQRTAREKRLEKRSVTTLRGLVIVLILATLGAFGLVAVAANQSSIAQQQRLRAETQSRLAQSRELVGYANANLDTDAELSTLLAIQAVNLTYTADGTLLPEANTLLHQAVQRLNPPVRLPAAPWPDVIYAPLSMSADGTRATYVTEISSPGGSPGESTVVDVRTGQILYTLAGDSLASTGYVDRVVTWTEDSAGSNLVAWDISSEESGRELGRFVLDPSIGETLDWLDISLDLKYALFYNPTNSVNRVFDLTMGEEITETVNLTKGKGFGQFSPNSDRLANINPAGALSILDVPTWQEIGLLSPAGARVNYFEFGPGGTHIITANSNNSVSVWDAANFTELYTISVDIPPSRLAFSPDGTRLAVASISGQVIIWDIVAQQELMRLSLGDKLGKIVFDANASRILTYHTDGQIQITNLVPGQEFLSVPNDAVTDFGPASLAYSPDGSRVVVASMSATPTIWDAQTGQRLSTLAAHTERVLAVTWSSDGETIATAGEDTDVILWNAETGEVKQTLSGHSDGIYSLAFSPDSSRVASSSYDQTVRIWDVVTGELTLTLEQPGRSKGVAWSSDGARIAAGTDIVEDNGHITIWDAVTGEQEQDIAVGSRVGMVVFSPDGANILAAMIEAQSASVWDIQSGELRLTVSNHTDLVGGIAYNPDGTSFATASHDGTTRLWDASTGQELLVLYGPDEGTPRVAFSPDGSRLATQNMDGTTRIYIVAIDDLIALAQSRLTRSLTDAECQRYLHTDTCLSET